MLKRKRDPTFATSEKLMLVDLVEKYFHIVECKKTDATSIKIKLQQWQKISEEFNAVSSLVHRDWNVLKSCWENLKKRAKQQNTQRHQHFLGTGGGSPKKIIMEKVLELIQTRVTGFVNAFDSDGTLLASGSSGPSQERDVEITIECQEDDSNIHTLEEVQINDWSEYTPNMLRNRRNPALARSPSPSSHYMEEPPVTQAPVVQAPVAQEICERPPSPPSRAHTSSAIAGPSTSSATTSRRRPTIKRTQDINAERLKILLSSNTHAQEEHAIQMEIFQIQKLKELEMLEQEKLKTEQEKLKTEQEKLKTEQEKIKLLILKDQFDKIKE